MVLECPPGFISIDGVDNCYKAGTKPLNWLDAANECQRFNNSHLVVIDNVAEQNAIKNWWMTHVAGNSTVIL